MTCMFPVTDNICILQTKCYIWGLYELYAIKRTILRKPLKCIIESFNETYEFESTSYYSCFNFDSSKCIVISMCEITHTQPKDKNIEILCQCVKPMCISQCILVADCTRTRAAKEILFTLRNCSFYPLDYKTVRVFLSLKWLFIG